MKVLRTERTYNARGEVVGVTVFVTGEASERVMAVRS